MAKSLTERLNDIETWLALGTLIFEFGFPAVMKILQTLKVDSVTVEDIIGLRSRLPLDEPFFDDK